jgi:glycerophosphoryl diester phosphodiesterase
MRVLSQWLGVGLGLSILGLGAAEGLPKAEVLMQRSSRPLVIAHRGYSAAAPENTLPAFLLAMEAEADLVELDYYHSQDQVLTVVHDGTLDRTTDAVRRWGTGTNRVSQTLFAKMRELDASSWRGSNQPPATIPSLIEALDLIQSRSVTLIERKAGPAEACVRLIRERREVNQVVVQSFDWQYLEEYHRLEPSQILGALGPWKSYRGASLSEAEQVLSVRWIDEARRVGARVVVWNQNIEASAVAAAHERGMKVWVYTIDDPADMTRLLDLGIDGLITNNPGRAWRVLAERRGRIGGSR